MTDGNEVSGMTPDGTDATASTAPGTSGPDMDVAAGEAEGSGRPRAADSRRGSCSSCSRCSPGCSSCSPGPSRTPARLPSHRCSDARRQKRPGPSTTARRSTCRDQGQLGGLELLRPRPACPACRSIPSRSSSPPTRSNWVPRAQSCTRSSYAARGRRGRRLLRRTGGDCRDLLRVRRLPRCVRRGARSGKPG